MQCKSCGIEFVSRLKSQKFCSEECREERYKLLARLANVGKTRKICKICKREYINKCNSSRYCSDQCRLKAGAKRQQSYRERQRKEKGHGEV